VRCCGWCESGAGRNEIESADDFLTAGPTFILVRRRLGAEENENEGRQSCK
jgi:hypothetical protein